MQPEQQLGELWISLCPSEEELRDCCGSRIFYQQQIIVEIIEQFGFDRQVWIQLPEPRIPGRRIPVRRPLHQVLQITYTSDYLMVQGVPQVTEEQLYRYNWGAGYTFITVNHTFRRRDEQQQE